MDEGRSCPRWLPTQTTSSLARFGPGTPALLVRLDLIYLCLDLVGILLQLQAFLERIQVSAKTLACNTRYQACLTKRPLNSIRLGAQRALLFLNLCRLSKPNVAGQVPEGTDGSGVLAISPLRAEEVALSFSRFMHIQDSVTSFPSSVGPDALSGLRNRPCELRPATKCFFVRHKSLLPRHGEYTRASRVIASSREHWQLHAHRYQILLCPIY
ncbi:hypothetical protein OE88DRAFT_110218 [Heliocybe sulcata]|uniref:Uncharacterized protein n=1 Tax=Heliocybe sulcata TaxID=5364 RepID=A0A5C3NM30_9AGAM|nr:hypothetical protein OE88DRAFT_110218 [Heliocybe sulcata]